MRIISRLAAHDSDGEAAAVTVTESIDGSGYRELTVGRGPGTPALWRTGVDRTAENTAAELTNLDDLIAALTAARDLLAEPRN